MNAHEMLLVSEVAARLRCGLDHVRNLIHKGTLRAFRDGKRFLIPANALDEYLMDREIMPDRNKK